MNNNHLDANGEFTTPILLNIAEILALRLPEGTERIIAAKWVKKFIECEPKDYKSNLSLFISTLTKQMLVAPFDVAPEGPRNVWQNFDKEYTQSDIFKAAMSRRYKDSIATPYKVDISQDMQEYVAFQEIPFFGAHFFYSFSPTEKINEWQNFRKLNVPRKFVDALKIADLEESLIKGRITTKPADRKRVAREREARKNDQIIIPLEGGGELNPALKNKLSQSQQLKLAKAALEGKTTPVAPVQTDEQLEAIVAAARKASEISQKQDELFDRYKRKAMSDPDSVAAFADGTARIGTAVEKISRKKYEQEIERSKRNILKRGVAVQCQELQTSTSHLSKAHERHSDKFSSNALLSLKSLKAKSGILKQSVNDREGLEEEAQANAASFLQSASNAVEAIGKAASRFMEIRPASEEDERTINGLLNNSQQLLNQAEVIVIEVLEGMDNNVPNLPAIVINARAELNEAINRSLEADEAIADSSNASKVILQAADVEQSRNDSLKQALESRADARKSQKIASAYGGDDYELKALSHYVPLDEEILLEINEENAESEGSLTGVGASSSVNLQNKIATDASRFAAVSEYIDYQANEDVENIEHQFNELSNESIETISNAIDDLIELQKQAETQEEHDSVQEVIEKLEDCREQLSMTLQDVNQAIEDIEPSLEILKLDCSSDDEL